MSEEQEKKKTPNRSRAEALAIALEVMFTTGKIEVRTDGDQNTDGIQFFRISSNGTQIMSIPVDSGGNVPREGCYVMGLSSGSAFALRMAHCLHAHFEGLGD